MTMTVGSLFSGVGGFDLGFERAGFDVRWQCEVDAACQDVLRRNFPDVGVIFSDVRTIDRGMLEPVDLIIGGFPCQDLSVAGRRAGLGGERSGLFYEFCRIIRAVRPRFALFENVPGLLSSDGGRDFALVLAELGNLGALDIGWAVLDAQWFGVPQRRRRVFIVCDFGGQRAAEILSLTEGLHRHPPPRREAGEGVAGSLGGGAGERGWAPDTDRITFLPAVVFGFSENQRAEVRLTDVSRQITSGGGKPGQGYPAVAFRQRTRPDGRNVEMAGDAAFSLQAGGGGDTNGQMVAFGISNDPTAKYAEEVMPGLQAKEKGGGRMDAVAMAFTERGRADGRNLEASEDVAYAVLSPDGGGKADSRQIMHNMAVRRLMPVECERLQGWPDGWTERGASGKVMSDSTRYRMVGNGVATPVAQWIAERIAKVMA